ncbi:glycoside hydrolase family 65 protein [Schleiferilactobacillus shenzhenensis]|uniref:TrePP n=1 Tax=Schleiferilactobacillus shenzhenensis LY-73 TaxID=1231336 RepID=U4TJK3_9LACO|nr:glycosyl hydrolase family 65 protein [Schleiferilactobacillus shenzhenensis]ERL65011.1 TrePP [Schleiferilactobacillus shenzhenensis LY-73]
MTKITLTVQPDTLLLQGAQGGEKSIPFSNDRDMTAIGQQLNRELTQMGATELQLLTPSVSQFSATVINLGGRRVDLATLVTDRTNIPVYGKENGVTNAAEAEELASRHLTYYGIYSGKKNYGQEALLTLGNGFFGLRGAYLSVDASDDNYPGFYAAGLFNQLTTKVAGHDVVNEDLVNLPNAQFLQVSVDGTPIDPQNAKIVDAYRDLDMQKGRLTLATVIALAPDKHLVVRAEKVVDMKEWHHYAVRMTVTPLDFSGTITITSKLDGSVVNSNVERYRAFNSRHFDVQKMAAQGATATMRAETKTSHVAFVIATKLAGADEWTGTTNDDVIRQKASRDLTSGQSWTVTKDVVLFTSLESADLDAQAQALLPVVSYDTARDNAAAEWRKIWQTSDIEIVGDVTSQKLARLNIFHAYVSASPIANPHLDASVGARGLHGEAYRGHVFWDELFNIPFYTQHYPKLAKALLKYRYRRLPAARAYAQSEHHQGAMYPWQSAMYGDEQSQFVHLNPITNQWDPDNSRRQRHVSLAVAYNVWYYYHNTQDVVFMKDYGLEMLLSIAKFWLSMAQYNEQTGRYDISGVMGPDEFHEGYPGEDKGVTNNTYTNIMVAWLFAQLQKFQAALPEDLWANSAAKADFSDTDWTQLNQVETKLALEVSPDGIISQYQGYFKLATIDLDAYRAKYGNISRMDRILKAEGKSPDAYQVAKQADALMAFWNLTPATVVSVFSDLGYDLPKDFMTKNLKFWLARTTHGSTLSRVVYSELAAQDQNADLSWQLFSEALSSDYYDIQGGTTAEGIHLGVMGATETIIQRDYAGVDDRGDALTITPHLPANWQSLHFKRLYKGAQLDFVITPAAVTITADRDLTVRVQGKPVRVPASEATTVKLAD